jgi:hypothetical protein
MEANMKLYLDDIRTPPDPENWLIVRNYNDFVEALQKHGEKIEFIAYDHDLADFHYREAVDGTLEFDYDAYVEKTGYHCAQYALMFYKGKHPDWVCHSWNVVGKKNIENLLT